ncbi:MAG: hypothetical protein UT21_C0006G0027 [Candidatus Woesebacteria bacterium GW2011_GWA1_39_11b]|nr:MAG: hypothetical protein UT21_C0006G0027 [Candidatus Woesebacteria bacterium GW2011_GWA1_39_11b]KKS77105.1 MAG: hypothetical protein UV51_C0010G0010 [Candidatus Woesebacteria bacterium GW2011_GWC1_42_9]
MVVPDKEAFIAEFARRTKTDHNEFIRKVWLFPKSYHGGVMDAYEYIMKLNRKK